MANERGKRILIVEDDPGHAELLFRILKSRLSSGHQVEICQLAEEAIDRVQRQQFDLIITDLRMPDANGLELIRHVRQVSPQTRTVLITAYPTPGVEDQAHQLAAIYLFKPFGIQDFVGTVQHILGEGKDNAVRRPNGCRM